MIRLGVSVGAGIAAPLTDEALEAISSSSIIKTLETSVNMLDGVSQQAAYKRNLKEIPHSDELSALQKKFLDTIHVKGITTPTYHAIFGPEHDLSSTDEAIRQFAIDYLIGEFSKAKELGAEIIVIHPSFEPIPPEQREDRIKCLRLSMAELEERVRKYGYRIAIELLPRTCLGNTADELLRIVEDFDESFGFCLDVNHLTDDIGGLIDAVRKLAPRLYAFHISDYEGGNEQHMLPGLGKIDWKALAAVLDEIGYDGPFTYELDRNKLAETPAERVKQIEDNFHQIFGI